MSYHENLGGEQDKLKWVPPKCTEMLQKEWNDGRRWQITEAWIKSLRIKVFLSEDVKTVGREAVVKHNIRRKFSWAATHDLL